MLQLVSGGVWLGSSDADLHTECDADSGSEHDADDHTDDHTERDADGGADIYADCHTDRDASDLSGPGRIMLEELGLLLERMLYWAE